jgi:anti-sigma factor RsiW
MTPEEASRLLHAHVDGELDAERSLELEALLERHPALRAARERIRDASAAIRDQAEYYRAPASLAGRLRASIPPAPESPTPSQPTLWRWLQPSAAFAAAAVLTWAVALATLRPGEDQRIAGEALAGHVRATLGGRLYDVASSDRHTVKPWLSARLDYSPPVADLAADGFPLLGARVDYVAGRPVAALVYRRREHVIDVYVRPGPAKAPRSDARDGFGIERVSAGGMEYWIVSDLEREELERFAGLLARGGAP